MSASLSSQHSRLAAAHAQRSESFRPGVLRTVMSAAKGMTGVIALARGDPDFDTPPNIRAAAREALETGITHYTPLTGLPELRAAIAEKLERENRLVVDPETEIAVTGGAQEALFVAVQMLVDPGDEVLLPDPHYSAYDGSIALAGGRPILVPSRGETRFELDVNDLKTKVTERTKLLILVDPSNPAGAVLTLEQVQQIAEFVLEHDLVVLSDEVYEKLVFDGREHTSIAALPGMRDRVVSLFSFSKSYAMTGWRIGYMVAPADFLARAAELHYTVSICASAPAQMAAIEALRGPQTQVEEMVASYEQRRDLLASAFREMGFPCIPPHGGFTVLVDIRKTGLSSLEMFHYILEQARVQTMPGSLYGPSGEGYIRVSVLAPRQQLEEAIGRIAVAMSRLDEGG